MKHIGIKVAAVAVSAALALAGCSSPATPTKGTSGAPVGGEIKMGLALSTLNNPFFVSLKEGAEAAAKSAGVALTVTDARDDATQQANQVQNFGTQQMKVVIINPVDSDAAGTMVTPIIKAGTPVVAVDRGVNGANVNSLVASDNVAGGKMAAAALAKAIGEKGKVIVLQGVAGTSASRDRGTGFEEGIKAFPNIQVVAKQPADFDRAKGLDVATNLLQANSDAVGIFAENDEMALGAIQALGDRAGKSVFVVGFDGTDDGVAAIKGGKMTASIAQQPKELGKMAIEVALKLAKGEKAEAKVAVPVIVIDKNTAQ